MLGELKNPLLTRNIIIPIIGPIPNINNTIFAVFLFSSESFLLVMLTLTFLFFDFLFIFLFKYLLLADFDNKNLFSL